MIPRGSLNREPWSSLAFCLTQSTPARRATDVGTAVRICESLPLSCQSSSRTTCVLVKVAFRLSWAVHPNHIPASCEVMSRMQLPSHSSFVYRSTSSHRSPQQSGTLHYPLYQSHQPMSYIPRNTHIASIPVCRSMQAHQEN